ncbi:MAG: serine/threonine-protein kinase [Myxococcota bacterium]
MGGSNSDGEGSKPAWPGGAMIGRYRVLRRLAVGGMAELYLAVGQGYQDVHKLVVLKRIRPGMEARSDMRDMLLDEARLAARFDHRNLVDVLDFDEVDGQPFYVMRYVPGADLRTVLAAARRHGRSVPLPLAVHVALEVATALHHVHELRDLEGRPLGVVHRDVSTANIRLGLRGEVSLLDFGIAKSRAQCSRTRVGHCKGNAAYMAPEQCRGEPVGPHTDVFALGIVLYEMVTMRRLFTAKDPLECMQQMLSGVIVPPSRVCPAVPSSLESVIITALQPEPSRRYPSALAMAEALEGVMSLQGWCSHGPAQARFLAELFVAPRRPIDEIVERSVPASNKVCEPDRSTAIEASNPQTAPGGPWVGEDERTVRMTAASFGTEV